jgi:hypothetical protein
MRWADIQPTKKRRRRRDEEKRDRRFEIVKAIKDAILANESIMKAIIHADNKEGAIKLIKLVEALKPSIFNLKNLYLYVIQKNKELYEQGS